MSEARQRHVGKTPQERQAYLNWLKDGGTTSRTPRPRSATDYLPDAREQGPLRPTQQPSGLSTPTVWDYVKEKLSSVLISVLGLAVLSIFGYFFLELNSLNREIGEISATVEGQAKERVRTMERVERKLDAVVKDINEKLTKDEERLYQHLDKHH